MKKEDVDKMTLQEACDYAVNKIVEQGKKCVLAKQCVYSDGEGNHCAVGWLLDKTNSKLMEATGGIRNLIEAPDISEHIPNLIKDNLCVFISLQSFHDSHKRWCRQESMLELAEVHKIDVRSNPNYQKWLNMAASGEEL